MTIQSAPIRTKIQGMLRLFRFELPFAAGVCVLLGEFLALGAFPTLRQIMLGFLSVFFISATALILNDYFDLETDRINAPERPLPSGLVTPAEAVWLSIAAALLGFLAAYLLSVTALIVCAFIWLVGFLYNWRLKRTGLLGNLMVSLSVGMTFIYGGIAVGQPWNQIVWLFGVIALLVDLGEEIAADAMDMEGDHLAGSRSLAVLLGREVAIRISAVIFLLVVVVSILPFLLDWLDWIYLITLALMDAVILYLTIRLLDSRSPHRRQHIRWIYLGASGAMVIFLVMQMVL